MRFIEPHAHMVSRVTDDYRDMVAAGCAAVTEPAFWAGFDRSSAQGFYDYFCQITEHEPKRAAKVVRSLEAGCRAFAEACKAGRQSGGTDPRALGLLAPKQS